MATQRESIVRRLLSTESEWNPKVMAGRVAAPVLPDSVMHRVKKSYYAYLMKNTPGDWLGRDAAVAERLISPGDSVLDVASNIGLYSRLLSRSVGPTGHVYAFEPIPQTFDFLSNNVRKLGLSNVEVLNFALSDIEKTTTMVIPTYRWGSECWYDAQVKTAKSNPDWREIQVRSRGLDNFFDERGSAPPIAFVKCDANYHELAVLRGALRMIRASRPAMLIEVNPDPDDPTSTAFETFALLRAEGLDPYWFNGEPLVPRKRGERSQNYFFLAAEHLAALAREPQHVVESLTDARP